MFPPSAVSKSPSSRSSSPLRNPGSRSTAYRLRVWSLGAALFALAASYLGVLVASATTSLWLISQIVRGGFTPIMGLTLGLGVGLTAVLTLVLTKGLFRPHSIDRSEWIRLTPEDEPDLFAFLEDIYTEADAPAPDRVYACPDVNAGVFVESSLRKLVRRPERHLLIGLGMVEALNRTELKAVLAHEFGHLSQRSMRLHDYARVLTAIFEQIICGRDRIDHQVDRWHRGRLHRRIFVFPLVAVSAVVRRSAGLLLRWIQRLEASVSRQMELEADRVAVNMTGSDALIHALRRTDWADRCYSQTLYDLEQAAGDGLRTTDLFYHQSQLDTRMRAGLADPTLGIPPTGCDDATAFPPVFAAIDDDEDVSRAEQWDSHPPHPLREKMARRQYMRSEFDRRSAWTLFSNPDDLRNAITDRIYTHRWSVDIEAMPADRVQRHLDGEHDELILEGDDQLVYGHRFIEPGGLEEAMEAAETIDWTDEELAEHLHQLTGPDFAEAARRIGRHVSKTAPGEPTPSGASPPNPGDAAEDHRWLAEWDRRLLVATIAAADRSRESCLDDLLQRVHAHLHLQDLVRWMRSQTPMLASAAAAISDDSADGEIRRTIDSTVTSLHSGLTRGLHQAPPMSELHGIPSQTPLHALVLTDPLVEAPGADECVDEAWLDQFSGQWQKASARLDHLRRKSLGALLATRRRIQQRFLDANTSTKKVASVADGDTACESRTVCPRPTARSILSAESQSVVIRLP